MTATDILKKIGEQAEAEATQIRKDGEKVVRVIEDTAEHNAKAIQAEAKEETARALTQNKERIESAGRTAVKKELDLAKREAINDVFEEVAVELTKLDDKKYKEIISSLLSKLPADAGGTLIVPKEREKITAGVLQEKKSKLKSIARDGFMGGFILESDDAEYDMTFEKILSDKKSELEVEVAGILIR